MDKNKPPQANGVLQFLAVPSASLARLRLAEVGDTPEHGDLIRIEQRVGFAARIILSGRDRSHYDAKAYGIPRRRTVGMLIGAARRIMVVMQPRNSLDRAAWWMKAIAVAFAAACMLTNFLARHAPPDFRYTGSDPATHVWNLGWPLALFIYDPKHGFQIGPFAYLMLPFQFGVLAVGLIVVAVVRRLHKKPMQRTGREALS